MNLEIAPLIPEDQSQWEILARGYKDFYKTVTSDVEYKVAWNRLLTQDEVFGIGAKTNDRLVGFAHFLFHTSTWAHSICYLQDLFVAPDVRGHGVARTLINAVATTARERGASRYYWLTQDHNSTARALYDKVAKFNGFIRYEFPLQ
jgi:GNAT superfamily N-acetyltransferase